MDGWMDRWMDGQTDTQHGVHHTVEYDSAVKRSEALTQATTWMDLETITLSEMSQTQKDTTV